MSIHTSITADQTLLEIMVTSARATGIAVMVDPGGNLGSGTLDIRARPVNSLSATPIVLNDATALALGDQKALHVGARMTIFLNMAGSTNPDVDIFISEIGGSL